MPVMIPMRIFFSKTGVVKYISHLDTMRTLTRALKRSGLPIWHTQGFNPHPYLTFALPIALGYESECESFDVRLVEELSPEEVVDRLGGALAPGFRALRAAAPVMDPADIAWADYEIVLRGLDAAGAGERLCSFLGQKEILVVKKTKKGQREVDISPLLELLDAGECGDGLLLRLRLASGNTVNINPSLFLGAFQRFSGLVPAAVSVKRTAILNGALENFC